MPRQQSEPLLDVRRVTKDYILGKTVKVKVTQGFLWGFIGDLI